MELRPPVTIARRGHFKDMDDQRFAWDLDEFDLMNAWERLASDNNMCTSRNQHMTRSGVQARDHIIA